MAKTRMNVLMTRLGLEVNETKTRLARIPEDNSTYLGYTHGQFYRKEGRPYIGTRPSRKAVKSLLKRIHNRTTTRWYADCSAAIWIRRQRQSGWESGVAASA